MLLIVIVMYKATYIGGHPTYPKKMKVELAIKGEEIQQYNKILPKIYTKFAEAKKA